MIVSQAQVATQNASKYLVQLSKHWSHRFPSLSYTAEQAEIPLPMGPCRLEATSERLNITVSAASEADVTRLRQVVADHLLRFAHREPLAIAWR